MITQEESKNEETKSVSVADLDMKLEVVVIPVSDVDRAKHDRAHPVEHAWCQREFAGLAAERVPLQSFAAKNLRIFLGTGPAPSQASESQFVDLCMAS